MIPVLIDAAAAVAAGAYALSSDDKSNGDWVVEKNRTTVPAEEVPAYIREKILRNRKDADVTEEIELELGSGEINFCPHCGAKVHTAGAKFCVNCGKSLVDE